MTILDPHLDIDQLSAAIDGDPDPAVAAHLLSCLSCREQVDTWRRALGTLKERPAFPSDISPLIDRALAAFPSAVEPEAGPAAYPADGDAGADPAAGAGPGTSTPGPVVLPSRRRRSARPGGGRRLLPPAAVRRLRPPPALAAVLILVVLVAAGVLALRQGGAGDSSKSSSAPTARVLPPGSPPVHPATAGSAPTSPAPSGRAATNSTGSASPSAPAVPAFAGTGAPLQAELRRLVAAGGGSPVGAEPPCLSQARLLLAGRDPAATTALSFTEPILLDDVNARVFVFAGDEHVALVIRSATCALLATVPF